ncbi:MAG TPA: PilZ domain-containing protein [Luteimonas sp.]|nr:PilZ domain-containing protein [Luteimonas sp.]
MTTVAAANQALFGDVLACEETRPSAFVAGAVDAAARQAFAARSEALLRALAVIEDGVRGEEPEQPADHALHRVEAKLDVLTLLVASVCAGAHDDPPRRLLWSARGACIGVDALVAAGTPGQFRVRPADWLPTPLLLPATAIAIDAGDDGEPRAWLRFDALPPALEAALERHLFRIHRRSIAESRRAR